MEKNKEEKILGLFFTKGVSVQLWKEKGLLDREKIIYEKLIEKKYFSKIYWFTYGINDRKYQKELNKNIKIIPMPSFFQFWGGKALYSVFLPFIQRKYLKQCLIYKTNQMMGSWTAVFSKWLYKKRLILRTGYTASLSLKTGHKLKKIEINLIEKFAYSHADYSFTSSKFDLEYIQKKQGVKNITCIPNYIEISLFKPTPDIEKNKDLVFIGRLSCEKNLLNLIKALGNTNYSLDIYGAGPLEKNLREKSKKIKAKIFFRGTVPNKKIPIILNKYKIFILPSFYEGMPKALLEAMACGLPCIGADVRGINEVIKHGYNGWLVKTDPKSIRTGIIRLMRDKKLREKLGKNARKTIEEKYSLEKILKKEIEIYNKLLKV